MYEERAARPDKEAKRRPVEGQVKYPDGSLKCPYCDNYIVEQVSPTGYAYYWCWKCNFYYAE